MTSSPEGKGGGGGGRARMTRIYHPTIQCLCVQWLNFSHLTGVNIFSGEYFSGGNIFQGWIFFSGESFSGVAPTRPDPRKRRPPRTSLVVVGTYIGERVVPEAIAKVFLNWNISAFLISPSSDAPVHHRLLCNNNFHRVHFQRAEYCRVPGCRSWS